jgi:hypothetical protein
MNVNSNDGQIQEGNEGPVDLSEFHEQLIEDQHETGADIAEMIKKKPLFETGHPYGASPSCSVFVHLKQEKETCRLLRACLLNNF